MGGAVSETSVDVSEQLEDNALMPVKDVCGTVLENAADNEKLRTGVATAVNEETDNPSNDLNEDVTTLIVSVSSAGRVDVLDPQLDPNPDTVVETIGVQVKESFFENEDILAEPPMNEDDAKAEESVRASSAEATSSILSLTDAKSNEQPHHLNETFEKQGPVMKIDSTMCADPEEIVERICDVVHTVENIVTACCSDSCDGNDGFDDNTNEGFAIIMEEVEELQQDDEVEEIKVVIEDSTLALAGKEVPEQVYVEEKTLCKDLDVFLYRIPVQKGERVLKAKEWDVQNPIVSGALELVRECTGKHTLFIYDEDGTLYGRAIISHYPSNVLEPTEDSSRYFLLTMTEIRGGTTRKMGIGFYDSRAFLEILKSAMTPEPGYENRGPRSKRRKIDRSAVSGVPSNSSEEGILQSTILEDTGKYETDDYPCQFCEQNFSTQTEIKTHWATKHGVRHPSDCPVCGLPFPNEKVMLRHRRFAHVFTCPDCKEVFRESQAAAEHIRKAHVT